MAHAERVGAAEFRGNLAKYLNRAKAGRPVIIQERGKSAYILVRFEDDEAAPAFGCMRERTECAAGAVVNATRESWSAGGLP